MSRVRKTEVVEEQRMVYGEVYAPDIPDSAGDYMTAEAIRKMAHDFVRKSRMQKVDVEHDNELIEGVQIVESFIAREGDDTFIPGAWVVGCHVNDDTTWDMIKKGELNGFSLEAYALTEKTEVEVEIPPVLSGTTGKEKDHVHKFYVTYGPEGEFLGGRTDTIDGHFHKIRSGTATEVAEEHSHRFSAVDDLAITG